MNTFLYHVLILSFKTLIGRDLKYIAIISEALLEILLHKFYCIYFSPILFFLPPG